MLQHVLIGRLLGESEHSESGSHCQQEFFHTSLCGAAEECKLMVHQANRHRPCYHVLAGPGPGSTTSESERGEWIDALFGLELEKLLG